MQHGITEIEVYDKHFGISSTMLVEQVSNNVFKTVQNEIFQYLLTLGTEFETIINKDGKHEVVKILKESDYITRRFFLNSQFNEAEFRLLGDEIVRRGGFWQVDLGSIATVNLPKDCDLNLDEIFRIFDFTPTEITE